MRVLSMVLGLSGLVGCIQDPSASIDEPERSEPQPEESMTDPALEQPSCGADLAVEFELLDAPKAGMPVDVRLRWDTSLDSIWRCCPYVPVPMVEVNGQPVDVPHHAEGHVDFQVIAPADEMVITARFCETRYSEILVVDASPFEQGRRELAACEGVEDGWPRDDNGTLRLTDVIVDGRIAPGAQVVLQASMAEVSGRGHGDYPGITFEGDALPDDPGVGQFFAIRGCDTLQAEWVVDLPGDLEVGSALTWQVHAGQPLCQGPECVSEHDGVRFTQRVLEPVVGD